MTAFPTLSSLRFSLTRAVTGLPAGSSQDLLQNIRQIRGFSTISRLDDLVTQDGLSRMIVNPTRFHEVSRTFTPFHDLPGLKGAMGLPNLDDRLGACAQVLDLRHGVEIYWMAASQREPRRFQEGALMALGRSISRALKDELMWPRHITLDSLGGFAVSLRQTFDRRTDHLTAEQRHHLMQIAVCLDTLSSTLCAVDSGEALTPSHIRKTATLIETLFGCGFGDDHWLTVSDLLRRTARNWERTETKSRNELMSRLGQEIVQIVEQVLTSYLTLLDNERTLDLVGALPHLSGYLTLFKP